MVSRIIGVFGLAFLVSCAEPDRFVVRHNAASSSSTGGPAPRRNDPSTGDSDSTSGEADDSTFLSAPRDDVPPAWQCDPWSQDCGPGRKCTYVSTPRGGDWSGTACRDIVRHPVAHGQPCQAFDQIGAGLDECGIGAMCWDIDPETLRGVCLELCSGSEQEPQCSDPEDVCALGKSISICMPRCTPLEMACPSGCGCYRTPGSIFMCLPDNSGEWGEVGDRCENDQQCRSGNGCMGGDFLPSSCQSSACCTPYCDWTAPSACPDADLGITCAPLYSEGAARPELEDVGVCRLP